MRKLWLIARTTFWRRVRSGTFLLLTFGLPAIMVVAGAIPILRETRGGLPSVGFVDRSEQIENIGNYSFEGETLEITILDSVEAAEQAFRSGAIQAYLVIPAGYAQGERPVFYSADDPSETTKSALESYLRHAVHPEEPAWVLERFENPARFTYTSLESNASVTEGPGLLIRVVTPVALGMIFALSVFTGANQLGSAIVREKDQRAMEMVITSIRPSTLVAGKVLGMTMVSLAQLGIWILGACIALLLALSGSVTFSPSMIHTRAILWAALLGIPGYFLFATIASGLGIIAGDHQNARQLAGMLGFVAMTPLYFVGFIVNAPNGALAVALTIFPLTSPTFSLIRMTLTNVPTWQLVAGAGTIVLCLLGGIWVVARVFRAAMLLYGQRLSGAEVWQAIRQAV